MHSQKKLSPELKAVIEAVFVTFLWSTSWVLIKIGLRASLPPITFAGLRYTLAFLCLLPFVISKKENLNQIKNLGRKELTSLLLLGIIFYTFTQGAQYVSLAYLPAAMVSLMLNLTPVFVAVTGMVFLKEFPRPLQWAGVAVTIAGVAVYFLPSGLSGISMAGLGAALICLAANSASALYGRHVNSKANLSPITITFVSMGIGAVIMLVVGIIFQGIGSLSLTDILIVIWLAVVNTAFAFTLWNKTLKQLTAVESSIINSLMLPQIALLAFIFLGEYLSIKQIAGLVLVSLGVFLVQFKFSKK